MASPVVHLGATVSCLHGGSATTAAGFARVTISGQPVVTLKTLYSIAGCGLSGASPCASARFVKGASRVQAGGSPVATLASTSSCVPTGAKLVPLQQTNRVLATMNGAG